MSTNLGYRRRERQRKKESGRQASETQREKGGQSCRVRECIKYVFLLHFVNLSFVQEVPWFVYTKQQKLV